MSDEKPLDPEAARVVAKVQRLMAIASATTCIPAAAVLGVIGYRVFSVEGRAAKGPAARALFVGLGYQMPAGHP